MERKWIYFSLSAEIPKMLIHTDGYLDFYNWIDQNFVEVSIRSDWEIEVNIYKTRNDYEDWKDTIWGWVIMIDDYVKFEAMNSDKFEPRERFNFAKMIQAKIDFAYELCFTY